MKGARSYSCTQPGSRGSGHQPWVKVQSAGWVKIQSAPTHSHIFQMFGRANPDAAIAGDGIGLVLCQRIVQAHGGRIWAESVPGEGSTFYVRLPRRMTGSNFGDL
ncbi:ATP-binding protein [Hydrogenophaga sp. H7]|uniref:ATP-binding protein n=1 Tax=Hydrogenophaga sp. H7 TaxID=1882399 RepID=UPI00277B56FD|nr:ATP-binding protein [Hydrogenophaga sp. H7]